VSQQSFEELRADDRLWWGKTGRTFPFRKRFQSELGDLVPNTVWLHEDVGNNREAKQEITKLFGKDAFATPKPERLIQRVVHVGSNPGDIVVDVFAGSGTTAAVAHKMGRRWLTAEVSDATVADFVEPRLQRVIDGADPGGITDAVEWLGGGGFRTIAVGPTMYEVLDNGAVILADWASNGRFAEAVAAQLGFDFDAAGSPFCGTRGRMRLAVFDGAVGAEEVLDLVGHLDEKERVTVVAQVVLDGADEALKEASPGSRIRKAPRDLLDDKKRRSLRTGSSK
jgi:adenine-specific DNA-methyltransferase